SFQIGCRTKMNFVNGFARCIEKLQASANMLTIKLCYSKTMHPMLREYAEIDFLTERKGRVRTPNRLFKRTYLFMHSAFIARQRHDFAKRRRMFKQGFHICTDAASRDRAVSFCTGVSRNEIGFRYPETLS